MRVAPLIIAALVACAPPAPESDTPASADAGSPGAPGAPAAPGLAIRAVPGALELSNGDTSAAYFVALEQETSARALWRPCTVPSDCRSVAPGATLRLPLDSIVGITPEATHAVVYWYHLVPAADGTTGHDSVRTVQVPLAAAR
jgi:hypothetical protein